MKKFKLQYIIGVFLFVTALFFTACSANKYSQSDLNKFFTNSRVKAKTSSVSFRVPKGWHTVDANNKEFIDLWFVRDDMKVSLSLLPIVSNTIELSLEKSYETSIEMNKIKYGVNNNFKIIREKPEILSGKKILFYNFKIDNKRFRVAVFEFNRKFYELTLYANNVNIKREYFIQELVISSAK
jgi:hypothetical protein